MSIDVNNANSVYAPSHQYATPKGDIKTLVKIMRSQSGDFETRDLVGEFNTVAEKNTPCKAGSPKQPSIKFLESVEKELKQANAHVGGTVKIANEYAKLLHNKNHLNQAYQKIQEQTILSSLRDGYNPIDVSPVLSQNINVPHTPHTSLKDIIPVGKITPPAAIAPSKIEIPKADNHYNLAPAPDIFSEAKTGQTSTYRIVPFNYVAGS